MIWDNIPITSCAIFGEYNWENPAVNRFTKVMLKVVGGFIHMDLPWDTSNSLQGEWSLLALSVSSNWRHCWVSKSVGCHGDSPGGESTHIISNARVAATTVMFHPARLYCAFSTLK